MSGKNLLYIFTRAPYSNVTGLEGLDAALIGASFDQNVSLLFMHDGVFQLKRNQDTEGSLLKQVTKMFAATPDFGIENQYVHDLSLVARNLVEGDLLMGVKALDTDTIRELVRQQFRVFTF